MREETLHSQLLVKGGSAHLTVYLSVQLTEIQLALAAYHQISTYGPLLKGGDLKQPMPGPDANGVQVQHLLPEDKVNYDTVQKYSEYPFQTLDANNFTRRINILFFFF